MKRLGTHELVIVKICWYIVEGLIGLLCGMEKSFSFFHYSCDELLYLWSPSIEREREREREREILIEKFARSDAFKSETENVINNLKGSTHWMVDKLKDMGFQSEELLTRFSEESDKIEGKLKGIHSQSKAFLEKTDQMEGTLKSVDETTQDTLQTSISLLNVQGAFQEEHMKMQDSLDKGMASLKKSVRETHEQLQGVVEVQKQIAEGQSHLAEAIVTEIEKLQEKATHMTLMMGDSLSGQEKLMLGQDELLSRQDQASLALGSLKQMQAVAMEETRSSLSGLAEEGRKHQREFKVWQLGLDQMHERLRASSDGMLQAQETFMDKQNTIFITLDRLFLLYNTILLESRALKTLFFYGIVIVIVHILTSAKHTNNARGLLYIGLCISLVIELSLGWFYGKAITSQHWIRQQNNRIRVAYGSFVIPVILYHLVTYRDMSFRNNQLLAELHHVVKGLGSLRFHEQDHSFMSQPLKSSGQKQIANQTMARRILRSVKKNIWRILFRNKKKGGNLRNSKEDSFIKWMEAHGMDMDMLETDSSDDDFIPDNQETSVHQMTFEPSRYHLRSLCKRDTNEARCTLSRKSIL